MDPTAGRITACDESIDAEFALKSLEVGPGPAQSSTDPPTCEQSTSTESPGAAPVPTNEGEAK